MVATAVFTPVSAPAALKHCPFVNLQDVVGLARHVCSGVLFGDVPADSLRWYVFSDAASTEDTLNCISYNRCVHPPPYPRDLRTVEEGVKGTQGQLVDGIYYCLLWINHYHREQLLWSHRLSEPESD